MNLLGNLIWLICGGFLSALGYFVMGFVFCISIIGIPFGIQCFKIGTFYNHYRHSIWQAAFKTG